MSNKGERTVLLLEGGLAWFADEGEQRERAFLAAFKALDALEMYEAAPPEGAREAALYKEAKQGFGAAARNFLEMRSQAEDEGWQLVAVREP